MVSTLGYAGSNLFIAVLLGRLASEGTEATTHSRPRLTIHHSLTTHSATHKTRSGRRWQLDVDMFGQMLPPKIGDEAEVDETLLDEFLVDRFLEPAPQAGEDGVPRERIRAVARDRRPESGQNLLNPTDLPGAFFLLPRNVEVQGGIQESLPELFRVPVGTMKFRLLPRIHGISPWLPVVPVLIITPPPEKVKSS